VQPVDPRAEVASRLQEQVRSHWFEFAVIVASANALSAVLLISSIATEGLPLDVVAISCIILAASLACAMLGYYSLQVASILTFGPIMLTHVITSFLIAGSQLFLFLWPVHVLSSEDKAGVQADELRHWLVIFGVFAVIAAIANRHASVVRSAQKLSPLFPEYERSQRYDRRAAAASGGLVFLCYVLSSWYPIVSTVIGVGLAALATVLGLRSQARASTDLLKAIAEATEPTVAPSP